MTGTAILVRDWRQMETALKAARDAGQAPTLVTPENAAATYGAGYLAALQERARQEFPDVAFTLIVDCGDAATGPVTQAQPAFVRGSELREPAAAVAVKLKLFSSSIAKPSQITKRFAGARKKRLYLSVKPFQIVMLKRTSVPTHLVEPSGVVGIHILSESQWNSPPRYANQFVSPSVGMND